MLSLCHLAVLKSANYVFCRNWTGDFRPAVLHFAGATVLALVHNLLFHRLIADVDPNFPDFRSQTLSRVLAPVKTVLIATIRCTN